MVLSASRANPTASRKFKRPPGWNIGDQWCKTTRPPILSLVVLGHGSEKRVFRSLGSIPEVAKKARQRRFNYRVIPPVTSRSCGGQGLYGRLAVWDRGRSICPWQRESRKK